MNDRNLLRCEISASTWRLELAMKLAVVILILTIAPSERLAAWFLQLFERHGLRLLSFRVR